LLPFAKKVTPKLPLDCAGCKTKAKMLWDPRKFPSQAQDQFPFPLRIFASFKTPCSYSGPNFLENCFLFDLRVSADRENTQIFEALAKTFGYGACLGAVATQHSRVSKLPPDLSG
jgi:hypothetical protein